MAAKTATRENATRGGERQASTTQHGCISCPRRRDGGSRLAALLSIACAALAGQPAGADVPAAPASAADGVPAPLQLAMTRSMARNADHRYAIDPQGHGVNPRHGLRLGFTPRGVRIAHAPGAAEIERAPRGASGDGSATVTEVTGIQSDRRRAAGSELLLRLERFGRGAGEPVRPVLPRIDGAWVEYDRGRGVSEWFANLPRGVEQGWTVTRRPAGRGPLTLELDTGRAPDRVEAGRLAWSGLVYHGLVALDARGRELPSRWVHEGSRLRIEVDDQAATYPLIVDPWVQQAKLVATDGSSGESFGSSVSLAGDTALVAAEFADVAGIAQGAAYIFTRDGDTWGEQAKLVAADGTVGDRFGSSVSLAGDTALVGAPSDGNSNQGAAYVFTRDGDIWSEQAKLIVADGAEVAGFGFSVSLAGDTALVGAASTVVDSNESQGAAYVFTRDGDTWSEQAKLIAADGAEGDQFGSSVSLAGDTALVGAPAGLLLPGPGAVYVFTRDGAAWSEQAKLVAADGAGEDFFGSSVSLAGDTALVGAELADVAGIAQGAAYAFTRDGDTWTEGAKLVAADGAGGDLFGFSVSLVGDTALVGAPTGFLQPGPGAAYIFARDGDTWSEQAKLVAADAGQDDRLGDSVSLDGITALVGAPNADVGSNFGQGAAYVFEMEVPPPVAVDDVYDDVPRCDSFSAHVLDNDELSGFEPAVSLVADAEHGTVDLSLDGPDAGRFTYTLLDGGNPATGDGFSYEVTTQGGSDEAMVTLDFEAPISLPVAADDVYETVPRNGTFTADVLGNDDPGDLEPVVELVSEPAFGTLDLAPDGSFAYTLDDPGSPAGSDSFSYQLGAGTCADTATVTLRFAPPVEPIALDVDFLEFDSDGNGVFEPGELVDVAPSWFNQFAPGQILNGIASELTGPEGAAYGLWLDEAYYGAVLPGESASCQDFVDQCYAVSVDAPERPAPHWDATLPETLSDQAASSHTWTLHLGDTFVDVPRSHPFYRAIETLLHHGVTAGCGGDGFCPAAGTTRAQMAVFALWSLEGDGFAPPLCALGEEQFADVPATSPFCPWIEELARRDILVGCGDGAFCPGDPVTRAQAAIYTLKTLEGPDFVPPACGGIFDDVSEDSQFCPWIEELFVRDIAAGCDGVRYCPGLPITRAQMSGFLTTTFGLELYGP